METPDPNPKKKLKDSIAAAKLDRRSGKYTSDPTNPSAGIFKDPDKAAQKDYKKSLTAKIKQMRQKSPQVMSQLAGGNVD